MNWKNKRCFTLVEILLVIGVIILITGVTAINVRRLYQEQKFNAEVSLVLDTLRAAQDLMMILQTDVSVVFTQNDKEAKIDYAIKFDKPPSKAWVGILTKKHPPLRAIKTLTFESVLPPVIGEHDGITLNFFSRGSVMSKGTLQISPYENDSVEGPLNRFICLKGYPAPLSVQIFPEKGNICEFDKETEYLTRLTDLTRRDVEVYETTTP